MKNTFVPNRYNILSIVITIGILYGYSMYFACTGNLTFTSVMTVTCKSANFLSYNLWIHMICGAISYTVASVLLKYRNSEDSR